MQADNNEGAMMSEADQRALWDEALRRTAERGGDPEDHVRRMIQEALDSLVADGSLETAGFNGAGRWSIGQNHQMTHHKQASRK